MNDIRISHLFKSYGSKPVLEDFSAVLESGAVTALMAPSGSGKTTLLRILLGLEQPDRGKIEGLEGLRIRAVFQEDRLCLHLTPADNLRLVSPVLSRQQAEQALEEVGLSDCLAQPVRELSGGMRRRVAILRAVLTPAEVLLLDEPFRGLDASTKALVMADTRRRAAGKTVLFVTHDASELEAFGADKCINL